MAVSVSKIRPFPPPCREWNKRSRKPIILKWPYLTEPAMELIGEKMGSLVDL